MDTATRVDSDGWKAGRARRKPVPETKVWTVEPVPVILAAAPLWRMGEGMRGLGDRDPIDDKAASNTPAGKGHLGLDAKEARHEG